MTRKDKLFEKFMKNPPIKGLTYAELESLLSGLGYRKSEGSGSRVKFFKPGTEDVISLHKPHPGKELKEYQVKYIQGCLKKAEK